MQTLTLKDFVNNVSINSIQQLKSSLKFISKWKKHWKIDTHNLTIYPNTLLNNIYRTLIRGASRNETIDFVSTTVDNSFHAALYCLQLNVDDNGLNNQQGLSLLEDIFAAKIGIETLKETYNQDKMLISQVETICDNIDAKMLALSKTYAAVANILLPKNDSLRIVASNNNNELQSTSSAADKA